MPELTPEQAAAHTWRPQPAERAAISQHSAEQPAAVTIAGLRGGQPMSHGRFTLETSRDPVGAPIFWREVPLMPTEGKKGGIRFVVLAYNAHGEGILSTRPQFHWTDQKLQVQAGCAPKLTCLSRC